MFDHHPALTMFTTPCFICLLYTYLLHENNALLDTYTTSYTCNEKVAHNTSRLLLPCARREFRQEARLPRGVDDGRVARSQLSGCEGCTRWPLQLLLIQRQNVILQSHDLSESMSALELHPYDRPRWPRVWTRTYDLFVIPKLEVVLHHLIFVPVNAPDHEQNRTWGRNGKWRETHFLMWYLSRYPFLTLLKSHATTYSPVEVTIAFSSWSAPMLNLKPWFRWPQSKHQGFSHHVPCRRK